jgi:hypothetical protein
MKKIKIYLDNCCFNRPYDDQEQITISLESEAKLQIQTRVKNDEVILIWSFMLDFENNQNIDTEKKNKINEWEKYSSEYFIGTDNTDKIAYCLMEKGFKSKDSVHIACAIETGCDYFITTDKGILNKKETVTELKIINPINYIIETGE